MFAWVFGFRIFLHIFANKPLCIFLVRLMASKVPALSAK
jgi:hypothetical protein